MPLGKIHLKGRRPSQRQEDSKVQEERGRRVHGSGQKPAAQPAQHLNKQNIDGLERERIESRIERRNGILGDDVTHVNNFHNTNCMTCI